MALFLAAVMTASVTASAPVKAAKRPEERPSPSGQLMIVSVNAKQAKVLDVHRFKRLHALTLALLDRPPAFDGGARASITVPDVIMLQEMSFSNVEILRRLLNQRSEFSYLFVATANSKTKMLVNTGTVTLVGDPEEWSDACVSDRQYLLARLTENASGAPFVAVNMHLQKNYSGASQCRTQNIEELHSLLANETAPIVVAGDFNQRPTAEYRECDLNEETEPAAWWALMTTPANGAPEFVDAVRDSSRNAGKAMESEWTHAQQTAREVCNGEFGFRRTRIDYIFVANAAVADAHADDPGWTIYNPKFHDLSYFRYSDHRWVSARISIAGPPRVGPVAVERFAGGVLKVSWEPVEGAAGYVVYRAKKGNAYGKRTTTDATTASFTDRATVHDATYRYSVAAITADNIQGIESRGVFAKADAKGPAVRWTNPRKGAKFVTRKTSLTVGFEERVAKSSVVDDLITLRLKGRKVAGHLQQVNRRTFSFVPKRRLKKNKTYRMRVRSVADTLGNRGATYFSSFST